MNTTSYLPASGDINTDALAGGIKWGGAVGAGVSLTFSIPTAGAAWQNNYSLDNEPIGFTPLSTAQAAQYRAALQAWGNVANINFVEVAEAGASVGDLRIAFSPAVQGSTFGWGYFPSTSAVGGDIWFNPTSGTGAPFGPGTAAFESLLHEIGHALGLQHPFDDGDDARFTTQMSVMSYNPWPNTLYREVTDNGGGSFSWTYENVAADTPSIVDIAAIQYLYGANNNFNTGNNSYTFSPTTPFLRTIWDAGGVDTISVSNFSEACVIDLNAGQYSAIVIHSDPLPQGVLDDTTGVYEGANNLGIAFGVVIENATGGSGHDVLIGNLVGNLLAGGNGNDTLLGGAGNDSLNGGAGNDSLDGGTGTDTLILSSSNSAVVASLTSRTSSGGSGNDALLNFENILGSNHSDTLTGNTGANRLEGAGGADTLNGGAGADTLIGGSGSDQFIVDNTADVVIELNADALSGNDTVIASASYTLPDNLENLRISGTGNIDATGNGLNNVLTAGAGNNTLNGQGGTDTASYAATAGAVNVSLALAGAQATGNSGTDTLISIENLTGSNYNDTLQGSLGNNVIEGGVGTDTLTFSAAVSGVTVSLAAKTGTGGEGSDHILRIENLVGTGFNDSLVGSSVANHFEGGAGDDTLNGSSGADTLLGGDGADWLIGGAGQDSLTGGAGADKFDFNAVAESGLTDTAWDIITDFNAAQGDTLDLSTLDADTGTALNQAFTFIGSAALTGAAQLRYDATTGMLTGSTDADAAAEFAIQLVGLPTFGVADLLA